jgi:cytochrome c peroxidase
MRLQVWTTLALIMGCLALLLGPATPNASAGQSLQEKARSLFEPIPDNPPKLKGNPATPEKVKLGKMLYFEPRLSASQLISCQTCHNVGLAGADLQETSIGHGWQEGPRNAPTVFNAVFNVAQFWDGRAEDLADQAEGPVQASIEMNNTLERVVETLSSMPEYVKLFKAAFPDREDPVTFANVTRAIEVYEATLITPGAPLDRYIKGNEQALSAEQEEGLKVFTNKGCSSCHFGVNLGGKSLISAATRSPTQPGTSMCSKLRPCATWPSPSPTSIPARSGVFWTQSPSWGRPNWATP